MPGISPLRIFIVENHRDTLNYLRMALETLGHTVFHAETVGEARERLPGAKCDVLICDIGLPDGDGWSLMRGLRDPIYGIAMSGFGTEADQARSLVVGFCAHLTKPFALNQLKGLLQDAAVWCAANAVTKSENPR